MKSYEIPKLIISCQFRPGDVLNTPAFIKAIIKSVLTDENMIIRANAKYTNYIHSLGGKSISLVKSNGKIRWINSTEQMIKNSLKYKPYAIAIESTYVLHKSDSSLSKLYNLVRKKSPKTLIIADIATMNDAIRAERLGADMVATTFARISERGGMCIHHKDHCKLIKNISNRYSPEGLFCCTHCAFVLPINARKNAIRKGYARNRVY